MRAFFSALASLAIAATAAVPLCAANSASPTDPATAPPALGEMLTSDGKYTVNNIAEDLIDVATAPLHIDKAGEILESPRFYLMLGGAAALWGGSYGLDQTMKSHLEGMSSSDADLLQNVSYGTVSAATALMYGYGLYANDERARHYAITAGEAAGVASLVDVGIKAAFGRLRPYQTSSHQEFFHGGQSFVSGDVTPMFALACGVSEYFDNRWYVAAPVYSAALLDGFGRMGNNAHWFSDVVGAALLGVGTTELFLHLHRLHEANPNRFEIFPVAPPAAPGARQAYAPTGMGIGIAYRW